VSLSTDRASSTVDDDLDHGCARDERFAAALSLSLIRTRLLHVGGGHSTGSATEMPNGEIGESRVSLR